MKLSNKNILFKKRRLQYAIVGILLSFIGPIGELIFVNIFSNYINDSFILTLIYTELITLFAFCLFGYIIGSHEEKVEEFALRDTLTGLYNRYYLMKKLDEFMALHKRHQIGFSLIMLDLDHFKKVNDTYGHLVGDKTLKVTATCIMQGIREIDIVSRFGGEEFIIVCPHANMTDCYRLAERIRIAVERLNADSLGFPGPQTISAGVYEISTVQETSLHQILNHVDQALYRAKEEGRNKVVIYDASITQ